ncbi:MAG TPA: hypothetical protein VLT83_03470 [Opitutaceae bacterium]|nr:hypothetical protein [Opitutaceae bacterium]
MNTAIDRKTFLKNSLSCAAGCLALATCPSVLHGAPAAPAAGPDAQSATTILDWLSPFIVREERNLSRADLIKLLEERGRLCCRSLDFRQKLVAESQGDTDKLVALMGRIVGAENCRREGDTIVLVYPMTKCGCGRTPQRAPAADDPYCECSKANNQKLFEIVSGRPVRVEVLESPRRGGSCCRFRIQLG